MKFFLDTMVGLLTMAVVLLLIMLIRVFGLEPLVAVICVTTACMILTLAIAWAIGGVIRSIFVSKETEE